MKQQALPYAVQLINDRYNNQSIKIIRSKTVNDFYKNKYLIVSFTIQQYKNNNEGYKIFVIDKNDFNNYVFLSAHDFWSYLKQTEMNKVFIDLLLNEMLLEVAPQRVNMQAHIRSIWADNMRSKIEIIANELCKCYCLETNGI